MKMSHRAKLGVAGAGALATVVAVTAVWATTGGSGPQVQAVANQPTSVTATTTSSTTTTSASPTTTTTTTTTSLSRTTTKPVTASRPTAAMPAPTAHPVDVPVPPPPHPAPVPGCTPTHLGADAAKADVKSALVTAAGKQYWAGTSSPPMLAGDTGPGTEPAVITVPPALLQAVAWQESGWQSSIHACDGGVGAMQIMAPTATWMNNRFGTSYDYNGLAGNAAIGAEYLEWLIAYFGENYFGYHYDMTNPDLMAAVIGAYNAGPSAVQFADGHTVVSRYAANVEALMSQQPWG